MKKPLLLIPFMGLFLFPLFLFASPCTKMFKDQLKSTAERTCKGDAQEIMATGNHMVSQSGKALEKDRYGFFLRCKKGESYIGLAKIISSDEKGTACQIQIESVSRVTQLFK